ncbi:MAG TPA: tRNA 4-thiouridine(8) synthase ThiI [Lachnospiraceae bacterium]|nr:tRNA 4-thiouridine(8) synthase ThiI [Lachnospiraceae bacterium]MDD7665544.1 tRNA 4-thiouridine(8) synthase ThiI [Lachnospiraceae bacterium]MDY4165011.1 tRNA uracil 4-sulfurtransferase ThiI [Lachnospiraceae bacterium]HAP02742.1 tRNA 4-thiouridine(8) synthase ThiI [Lachnospiraceae bacterium]
MEKAFLVKYGEIGLKGKNRFYFEETLVKRIEEALAKIDGSFTVTRPQGRIFVEGSGFDEDEVIDALSKVFGIIWICPCVMTDDTGFDDLSKQIIDYLKEELGDKPFTFKVEARRARKNYPMNSMEINRELGERILDAFPASKVDVHHPEHLVEVEIRERINFHIFYHKGVGGMPVGTAGKAMLLLSGGIDSPVAGYMIARRGVTIDATYFHAPPYTSERAKQKVVDLAKIISKYTGPIRLHVVNFTDIQMAIYEKCPHDELTIIMRRYMMIIAEHFANEDGDMALITGESLGQVASQTMQSLYVTDHAATLPVFRPLIGFDKQDIIEISEKIGTYETSILPYEDCCTIFVAKHPVTKPRLDVIERSEKKLADVIDDMLQTAYDTTETILVK